MEIFHHFGIKIARESDAIALSDLGIELERGPRHLPGSAAASFQISEDASNWKVIQSTAKPLVITDFVTTKFNQTELDAAQALCIVGKLVKGYPEPSQTFGFLKATYDLSGYCRQCGVGLRQINPFRVRIHPTLKRSMLQLNWVADEFFVSREVWADVFCPLGIDHWPVISARTGEPLNSVVQLRISEQADLKVSNSEGESCSCCGRIKMPFLLRGFAPEPCCIPSPIFRSAQYFGTGANAFNRVLVSAPLFREIQRHTLRGIEFYPCASNSRTDGAS